MTSPESKPASGFIPAICLDGRCFIGDDISFTDLSVADRGLLLGDGLFETLPLLNGHAIWLKAHLTRLMNSAEQIGLSLDRQKIIGSVDKLKEINKHCNAILRITVTRGAGGRGLLPPQTATPTILASLAPLPKSLAFQDVKLITSSIRRNDQSPTSRIKSLNYLDSILASQEAEKRGAEDALMLNTQGMVSCTTIGNLFAVFGKRIVTPPITDGVLPGILRGQLLENAEKWGLEAITDRLTEDQLRKADGLFLTNSLRIIRRVTQLDDHAFCHQPGNKDMIFNLQALMRKQIEEQTGADMT